MEFFEVCTRRRIIKCFVYNKKIDSIIINSYEKIFFSFFVNANAIIYKNTCNVRIFK